MPGENIEIREIPVAAICVPDGLRKVRSAIEGTPLAKSIAADGVLQPITVMPDPSDKAGFIIIDGVARLEGVKQAGGDLITAIVDSGENASALRVIVNLVRADAHPVDVAHMVAAAIQEGMLREALMAALGKSASWISENMKIARIPLEMVTSILAGEPNITRDKLIRIARQLQRKTTTRRFTRTRPLDARQRAKDIATIDSVTVLLRGMVTQLHALRHELAETVEPARRKWQTSALEDLQIENRAIAHIVDPILRELNSGDNDPTAL